LNQVQEGRHARLEELHGVRPNRRQPVPVLGTRREQPTQVPFCFLKKGAWRDRGL
jgi:hypothetical protein